jgi:hypothetical protein
MREKCAKTRTLILKNLKNFEQLSSNMHPMNLPNRFGMSKPRLKVLLKWKTSQY